MGQNVMEQAFAKAKAAIDAAVAERNAIAAPALEAQKKALAAVEAAKAASAVQQANVAMQAVLEKAAAAKKWKDQEETIEDALEHAGISGVDVQIDVNGFAKLVGKVTSELDRDTAVSMAEQFQVTGMDVQLEVVPPPPVDHSADPTPADQPVKYKVKAGESWWGIAQRVYGNGQLWKSLKAANNNPKMIHPGTEIILPPKSALK